MRLLEPHRLYVSSKIWSKCIYLLPSEPTICDRDLAPGDPDVENLSVVFLFFEGERRRYIWIELLYRRR